MPDVLSGELTVSEAFATLLYLALGLSVLVAAWKVWPGPQVAKRRTFNLDWFGEPARPGFDARLGMPEQVADLKESGQETHRLVEILGRKFDDLLARVDPAGLATHAEVQQVSERLASHIADKTVLLADHAARLERLEGQVAGIPRSDSGHAD